MNLLFLEKEIPRASHSMVEDCYPFFMDFKSLDTYRPPFPWPKKSLTLYRTNYSPDSYSSFSTGHRILPLFFEQLLQVSSVSSRQ